MVSTPANALDISSAGLVKFDGTATFSGVTTTQHDVLIGAASNGITNVAPSATSGVPLISQGAAADPAFGTAVVAGGGTGRTTLTDHGVLVGAGTAAITQLSVGTNGQVLIGSSGADPAFATLTSTGSSITYTTGANTLNLDITSWVAVTTWTPALAFGGGTTGITYAAQVGYYQRIGNAVYISCDLQLTNKGSSTGAATITGFPVSTSTHGANMFMAVPAWALDLPASYTMVSMAGQASSTTMNINLSGDNVSYINADNTNFSNTSFIRFSGVYFII